MILTEDGTGIHLGSETISLFYCNFNFLVTGEHKTRGDTISSYTDKSNQYNFSSHTKNRFGGYASTGFFDGAGEQSFDGQNPHYQENNIRWQISTVTLGGAPSPELTFKGGIEVDHYTEYYSSWLPDYGDNIEHERDVMLYRSAFGSCPKYLKNIIEQASAHIFDVQFKTKSLNKLSESGHEKQYYR